MNINYNTGFQINSIKPDQQTAVIQAKAKESQIPPAFLEMKKAGIFLTGLLPISSRGIPSALVKGSLSLIQNLGMGFTQLVKGLPVTTFDQIKKDLAAIQKDWHSGGIQESYQDITCIDRTVALEIVEEGYDYAMDHQYEPKPLNEVSNTAQLHFKDIHGKLEELGFKQDKTGAYYHLETGTMFNLSFDPFKREIMVCFWGLGNEAKLQIGKLDKLQVGIQSHLAAVGDFAGKVQPSAIQAAKVGEILKEVAEKSKLTPIVMGHSHGGGLAQCAALSNGIKAVAFNSRPMGAGMRRFIGLDKLTENAKNITQFSVKGDILTGLPGLNLLPVIFERLTGIMVPRNIGTGYRLPFPVLKDPHNSYIYSMSMAKMQLKKSI
jgi:hypothetical protein